MAASRTASTANTNNGASTAPLRISFAKIKEPLEVPNLLALQTESFDWLLGNTAWQSRVEEALDVTGFDRSLERRERGAGLVR